MLHFKFQYTLMRYVLNEIRNLLWEINLVLCLFNMFKMEKA